MASSTLTASLCRRSSAASTHILRWPQPSCTPSVISRRAMMSALRSPTTTTPPSTIQSLSDSPSSPSTSSSSASSSAGTMVPLDARTRLSNDAAAPQTAARPPAVPKAEKPRPKLRATKAALTMTPGAVFRLRNLMNGPTPQLIRVGVRNKGCAGMSYHLEYVEKPGKFDEVVEQDGVKVLIDSKALFSIIGSEMDWKEDSLSSKFVFHNPNIKDACGCGESFNVGS